jgi:hypothetical protein
VKSRSLTILSIAVVLLLAGCGDSSSPTNVGTAIEALDTTPPPAPENVAIALSSTTGYYNIQWDASAAPDVAGYEVYKYTPVPSHTDAYQLVGQSTGTSWTLTSTTTEYYRVRAIDQAGNRSAYSAMVSGAQIVLPSGTPSKRFNQN